MATLIPPTYEDATLVLRLYELRREERLRAAREWFRAKFFPQSYEDVKAVALSAGAENEHYRMVTTYWDMAASFVAQGVLHPELFFDSSGVFGVDTRAVLNEAGYSDASLSTRSTTRFEYPHSLSYQASTLR